MTREYAKIVDADGTIQPNLVRDMFSKAILNTDTSVVRKHQKRLIDLQKEENRTREIDNLKSELDEIKGLLRDLIKQEVR